jgi:integrase/recombinase XerD
LRNEGVQNKTVQPVVQRFAKEVGLENATHYTLVHRFANTLIDAEVFLEKVESLVRHSNLNTTWIYTAPGQEDIEEVIRKIDV